MVANELYLDKRLQDKSIRDSKMTRNDVENHLKGLEDQVGNLVEFDDQSNPTNLPEAKLKELEMKTAEPELYKPEEVEEELLPAEDII